MKTLLLYFIVMILGANPAFAYIDPGSGSAILSVIIGFFVAIGMVVKTFWYNIKRFFGLSRSNDSIKGGRKKKPK